MKTESMEPVPLSVVYKMLKKREKEGEIGYEQENALEHAKKFAGKEKEELELVENLKQMKIPAETAVNIVNVKPTKKDTLQSILIRENVELSEEEIKKIIKIFG
ncbi:hypothetical protein KAW38_04485 [Candidatus Micrarchaeota archaeon]|nr:hypothetical protein [Candidatus Micrarchaeota archaeon]